MSRAETNVRDCMSPGQMYVLASSLNPAAKMSPVARTTAIVTLLASACCCHSTARRIQLNCHRAAVTVVGRLIGTLRQICDADAVGYCLEDVSK